MFEALVENISETAFFYFRNIVKIGNELLSGCLTRSISKLQLVQNAVARFLRTRRYHSYCMLSYHTALALTETLCSDYKLLTYKALNGLKPQNLGKNLIFYVPPHLLRSKGADRLLGPQVVKATAGGQSFLLQSLIVIKQTSCKCSGHDYSLSIIYLSRKLI